MNGENKHKTLGGVIRNLIFSFLSSAMPSVMLQFIVQPILASKLGIELNGQYLTIMSLNFFLVSSTASALSTTRMLLDSEYEKKSILGDFNIFLFCYFGLAFLVMPLGYIFYTKTFGLIDMLLVATISVLHIYHDYSATQYRLSFQYNRVLISNSLLVLGYIMGLLLYDIVGKWQIVIISAYFLSGLYDISHTDYIREPAKKTCFYQVTRKKLGILTVSGMLEASTSYLDKLLLFPILGGAQVSIYNTAAMVGKMLLLLSWPLRSVAMSYLVKTEEFHLKNRKMVFMAIVAGGVILYFGSMLVGYPITSLLYPDWAALSYSFIPVTTLTGVFSLLVELLNAVVVRFCKTQYQMMLQGIGLLLYLSLVLVLTGRWSLLGFCIGVATYKVIQTLILLFIIWKHVLKEPVKDV